MEKSATYYEIERMDEDGDDEIWVSGETVLADAMIKCHRLREQQPKYTFTINEVTMTTVIKRLDY